MDIKLIIPDEIISLLIDQHYYIDDIGCSDSKILIFNTQVLKIEKESIESNTEHIMLKWLDSKIPVPKIIATYYKEGLNYLLMSRLAGKMSCDEEFLKRPEYLVKLLAIGLKKLWDVDINDCPILSDLDYKLGLAKYRIENGLVGMEDAQPETYSPTGFNNPKDLYQYLEKNQPKNNDLVLSHGDYCLPNIFINYDSISGYIDLGRSGICDKWNDIALCVRSLEYNLGTDRYTYLLFKELGFELDEEKIRYYILLDELF